MAKGADPELKDQFDKTPLDLAPTLSVLAKTGLVGAMKWLHNVDKARWDPTAVDEYNRTPLHAAAYCGRNWKHSKTLSRMGAHGKCEAAQWLVDKGCSPHHTDLLRQSPRSICTPVYNGVAGYESNYAAGPIYAQMQRALDARAPPATTLRSSVCAAAPARPPAPAQERCVLPKAPAVPEVRKCSLAYAVMEEACARSRRANESRPNGQKLCSYADFEKEVAKEYGAMSWPRDCRQGGGLEFKVL